MIKKNDIEVAGWYGTVAIILAYALVSFNIVTASSWQYQILNLTGAVGVAIVSLARKARQPAILNIFWAMIALVAIVRLVMR